MVSKVEEAASKGMGKVKQAKARMKSLTGVFERLAEEHGEVAALLERGGASSDMEKLKNDIFPRVRKELLSHERGELDEVYSVLQQHRETQAIAEEHNEEATEMQTLIGQLSDGNLEDREWKATFERLAHTVQRHAEQEEDSFFPEAQQVLGEDRAKQLEEPYLKRKQTIMQELG